MGTSGALSRGLSRGLSRALSGNPGGGGFRGPLLMLGLGNSYEYLPDIGVVVDALMEALGYEANCQTRAVDMYGFDEHLASGDSESSVAANPWTHGSLQDESKGLTVANGTRADHIEDGVELAQWFYDANADCQILVQETAAYAVGHADVDGSPFTDPDDMYEQVRDGYALFQAALVEAYPGRSFPIVRHGLAVWAYGGNYASSNPDYVNLHNPDKTHLNDDSRLLKACMRVTAITGRSAESVAAAVAVTLDLELGEAAAELARFGYRVQKFGTYGPTFAVHPAAQAVAPGADVSFTVEARGHPAATLQWYRDGVAIEGATAATLELADVEESDNGALIKCVATNSEGSRVSAEVALTVGITAFKLDFSTNAAGAVSGYTKIFSPNDDETGLTAGVSTWAIAGTSYTVRYISGDLGANTNGIAGVLGTPGDVSATNILGLTMPLIFDIEGLPPGAVVHMEALGPRINDGSHRETKLTLGGTTNVVLSWNAGSTPVAMPAGNVTVPASGKIRLTLEMDTGNTVNLTWLAMVTADPV